jgi:hypothetical protein
MRSIGLLGREVPAVILASVLILAGVGAAAGTAVSGSVSGDAATEVEQAILLNSGEGAVDVTGADSQVVQVDDEDKAFRTAATIQQGEDYEVTASFDNTADEEIPAKLVVNTNAPLRIDASSDDITVQRVSNTEFILAIPGNETDQSIEVELTAANDANPGFTETDFSLEPVEIGRASDE